MVAMVALAAHLIFWNGSPQIGVGLGEGNEQRLTLFVSGQGCPAGMKIYSGYYGDFEAALAVLAHSNVCAMAEVRRAASPSAFPAQRSTSGSKAQH